jgi:hypothetical protein
MPKPVIFGLFAIVFVSPRMSDEAALVSAAIMLASMFIAIWKSDD